MFKFDTELILYIMPYKISLRIVSKQDNKQRIDKEIILDELHPHFKKRLKNFESMKYCYHLPLTKNLKKSN